MKRILTLILFGFSAVLMAQPTLTVTQITTCYSAGSGDSVNVTISNNTGPSTYSWSSAGPGSCTDQLMHATGQNATFSVGCCGSHTITCSVYNGSTLCCVAQVTFNTQCPPVVTLSSTSSSLCGGQTATLSAFGAMTYTFLPGSLMGSPVVVMPSSSTCYSVYGTAPNGCVGMASTCISVSPTPTVSVSGASLICPGATTTLTATGAGPFNWSPSGSTASSIVVSPSVSTCYTVTTGAGACVGNTMACVVLFPFPNVTISGPSTVCAGSSATLVGGGGVNYAWNTGLSTHSAAVLPSVLTTYSLYVTDANGCSAMATHSVLPLTSCAIVWPGDANSDGVVNSTDVVELGLYANSTGAARSPGGNVYNGQFATSWTGSGSNSQNRCHVDCNGDGTVDANDTLAIFNNFSLTHSFRESAGSAGDDITLVAPSFIPSNQSTWQKVDVILGSSTNVKSAVYGIVFELNYDPSFVDNNQVYVTYPASFLSAGSQMIPFRRPNASGAMVNCVFVRTDGANVSGHGKIAEFHFKTNGNNSGQAMNLSVKNAQIVNNAGVPTSLTDGTVAIQAIPVGVDQVSNTPFVTLYPVPAEDVIRIAGAKEDSGYRLMDVSGRVMLEGKLSGTAAIDVSGLQRGTYFITLSAADGSAVSRRVILR